MAQPESILNSSSEVTSPPSESSAEMNTSARIRSLLLAAALLMALSACRPNQPPSPTPRPTQPPEIVRGTLDAKLTARPTLRPSWTPLPTWTPAPTRTPIPTKTAVPTLTADDICKLFAVVAAPPEGASYNADAQIQFGWSNVPTGASGTLFVRLLNSNDTGLRYNIPTDGDVLFAFPLSRLAGFGTYGWRITVTHPTYGEICAAQGTFTRTTGTPIPLVTFTPVPVQPTATPVVF